MPPGIRLQAAIAFLGRHDRPVFLLASLGVNLAVFAVLAVAPGRDYSGAADLVIPVSIVEIVAEPPPPEPEPEPEPEPPAEPLPEPDPVPAEEPLSRAPDPSPIRSPVIAAPDETADAVAATGEPAEDGEPALSSISPAQEKAVRALKGFRCNRLGADRPGGCEDSATQTLASIAEEPDVESKRWVEFKLPVIDPEIRRIWAEDCPPKDGVINDVFTQDTTYYRQGAHAGAGSLSKNSINKRCP